MLLFSLGVHGLSFTFMVIKSLMVSCNKDKRWSVSSKVSKLNALSTVELDPDKHMTKFATMQSLESFFTTSGIARVKTKIWLSQHMQILRHVQNTARALFTSGHGLKIKKVIQFLFNY